MLTQDYELIIQPDRVRGKFAKGRIPHNKGIPMREWMPEEKIPVVLAGIIKGMGRPGHNKKAVVTIYNGRIIPFESSHDAVRKLRPKGFRVWERNINKVCHGTRNFAGGLRWFFADDYEKINEFIK